LIEERSQEANERLKGKRCHHRSEKKEGGKEKKRKSRATANYVNPLTAVEKNQRIRPE